MKTLEPNTNMPVFRASTITTEFKTHPKQCLVETHFNQTSLPERQSTKYICDELRQPLLLFNNSKDTKLKKLKVFAQQSID